MAPHRLNAKRHFPLTPPAAPSLMEASLVAVGVKLVGTSLVKLMLLVAPPGSLVFYSEG